MGLMGRTVPPARLARLALKDPQGLRAQLVPPAQQVHKALPEWWPPLHR
jgi:hypothetical protein